ncbi:putative Zn-dependent protease [uncultured Desulfatiglans sp.]|uniref:Putative Zn-dependent protease n=1 Tax=Uncultured Desulfatiglans sp. TaxID=1748965 RepID=A0A653AHB9_UNCDX|nr:putative Zn-dependent protease [uncultured Desulfatiglans sp.]
MEGLKGSLMKKRGFRNQWIFVLLAVCLLILPACAIDPVTGRTQLMLVSEEQEIQMGRQSDQAVSREYGLYDNTALTAYVAGIGQRLGGLSHRPHLPYQFAVLDTAVVNAFAAPGGYVYMTRGILGFLNSEAELAAVLGHELGHITARHSAEQYSRAQLAQIGLAAGMLFSPTLQRFGDAAQTGVQLLFLSFSRENEREADDLGVEYASKAGYDANQMAVFFETLERMNPSSDRSGLPEWFSTHPNPDDRMGAVRRKTAEWQGRLGARQYRVDRERYLMRIDGLVFGDNPREGYTAGGVFYHPDLRFQFPVPGGWTLQNTRQVVRVMSPRKDAALTLSVAAAGTPRDAAGAFVSQSGAQVVDSGEETVNGLRAVRLVSQVRTSQGVLGVLSTFIQKDGKIFEFQGFCAAGSFSSYSPVFRQAVGGFQALRDSTRINVRPDRIRIVKAPSSGTLGQVLRTLGAPQDKVEEWALLNGGSVNTPVEKGALVKVIRK